MAGRKKDPIWNRYQEVKTATGKGVRAKCIQCGQEMQGLVARMKKHSCTASLINVSEDEDATAENSMTKQQSTTSASAGPSNQGASSSQDILTPQSKSKIRRLDNFVTRTTAHEKHNFDIQVGRLIYATNSSFRTVENPEFKKLIDMLRPGYKPPSRFDVSGCLLDEVFTTEIEKCAEMLKGETVSMCIDGWSNIHNEPILCTCVTTSTGDVYLIDTIDSSGHSHCHEYLSKIGMESVRKCQNKFQCSVRSFVSDNAANMAKMREEMEMTEDVDLVTYGCSAHILNLLAKDFYIPQVKEQVVQIMKYFRNNHFARAKYREQGGSELILPQDVRWNSMCNCLKSYLKNWSILMKVVEENRDKIDTEIKNKVLNIGIKRNAEELYQRLMPIAAALNTAQKNTCTISQAVFVWKKLELKLKLQNMNRGSMNSFRKRYEQAMTSAHFLANLIDPVVKFHKQYVKYPSLSLTKEEKTSALQYVHDKYGPTGSSFLALIVNFEARSGPFNVPMFEKTLLTQVRALDWWKSIANLSDGVGKRELEIVTQLLTAVSSSAGVERIFSTFGMVHSKIRNKLGTEKAAKLVFLMKLLNPQPKWKDPKDAESEFDSE